MQKSKTHNFEVFNATSYKVGLACAQFNSDVTEQILASALKQLKQYQVKDSCITICRVAGSVEIPVMLQTLAKTKKYDCLIAVGVVIKGQTDHYRYVADFVVDGILRVSLDYNLPVGLAVLTVPNKKLAQARVDIGGQAVVAALQSVNTIKQLRA